MNETPETVAPAEGASNQTPPTSNDAVMAVLANVADALKGINQRLSNVEAQQVPLSATQAVGSQVETRNVEPPETPHPDHLNGVYHVLHTIIDRVGIDENHRTVLHNAIPNVNPPEAPPEAQAA